MEKYSLRAAAKIVGIAPSTFNFYKKRGIVIPDVADNQGNLTLYSETQIKAAKDYRAANPPKSKKLDDSKGNLFDAPAKIDSNCEIGGSDDDDREKEKFSSFEEQTFESYSELLQDEMQNSEAAIGQPAPAVETLRADSDDDSAEKTASNKAPQRFSEKSAFDPEGFFAITQAAPMGDAPIVETPPFIEDMAVPLKEKTLQELADEGRLCFERGDDYFRQGAKYYIEGGRRLIEAKQRLKHGDWQNWLKENFSFSQDTASNYMKLAERFGGAKSETFRIFKPATLIKLLALPEGDEERFIEAQAESGKPIESQSAREVQKAVKEWKSGGSKTPSDDDREKEKFSSFEETPPPADDTPPEIGGSYFNATGSPKNNSVVDELNGRNETPADVDSGESNSSSFEENATADNADDAESISEDTPPARKYAELIIDEEFSNILPPLTDEEFEGLERNILRHGIIVPLVVWNCILLDGHARYEIAKRHNLPFKIVEVKNVADRNDAILWIVDNQLNRKNLTLAERIKLTIDAEKVLQELIGSDDGDDDGSNPR